MHLYLGTIYLPFQFCAQRNAIVITVCCALAIVGSGCNEHSEFEFQSDLHNPVKRLPERSDPEVFRDYTFVLKKQNLSFLDGDDVELGAATCLITLSRVAWKDGAIWALSRCSCFNSHSGTYYFGSEPPVVQYIVNGDHVEFLLSLEFLFAKHEDGPLLQKEFNDINFGEVYATLQSIAGDTTGGGPDTLTFTNGGPVNDPGNAALIRLKRVFRFRNTAIGLQAAVVSKPDTSEMYKLADWLGPDTYTIVESSDLLQPLPAGDATKTVRPIWQGHASSNVNGGSVEVTFPGSKEPGDDQ